MPMLIAWVLVLGVSLFLSERWGGAVGWLKGQTVAAKEKPAKDLRTINTNSGTEPRAQDTPAATNSSTGADISDQIIVFLAFLVCVAFSSFIALNFQAPLIRLYAGYDLNFRFVTPLFKRKRRK